MLKFPIAVLLFTGMAFPAMAKMPDIDPAAYPPSGVFGFPAFALSPDEQAARQARIDANNRFLADNGIAPLEMSPLDPCFVKFYAKDATGHYTGYAIDEALFAEKGTVSYIKTDDGQCSFDAETRVETCDLMMLDSEMTLTTQFDSDSFTRLLEFFGPDEFDAWKSGDLPADFFDVLDCSPVAQTLFAHIEDGTPDHIDYPDDGDEGAVFRRAIADPDFVKKTRAAEQGG
ncbi:hypothetical protein FJU08_19930 [Martelella alba]|uniref:Uncharacterized protein n=1 Tax=Martelella alba TaxID=2590451 RepID=A0A506U1Z9_9HYPH|nr:hypothetical protein [Martelella alba]TPW27488.1 hypothetical protein FJU08_19930 [Martelella alba]